MKNIILDMDGTLLSHDISFNPIPRPYLAEFMQFVFQKFERVSIWTAACDEWYLRCYHDVLKHHIPEGRSFHFVKTREDFDVSKMVKPLSMIYTEYPDLYNPENTLIVDDNFVTFMENLDNAIEVIPFNYMMTPSFVQQNLAGYDYALLQTIKEITHRLQTEKKDIFFF